MIQTPVSTSLHRTSSSLIPSTPSTPFNSLAISSTNTLPTSSTALHKSTRQTNITANQATTPSSRARDLHLVGDGLALLDGVDGKRALLAVQLVGQLGVVLDVRDADLGVVAVEDAGDFLESGTPVVSKSVIKVSDNGWVIRATTYLVST